jgi:hypothetical protein
MTAAPRKLFYRLLIVMLVLFCLWLALPTRNVEVEIAKHLPTWVVWTNLLLLPFILAVAAGPSRIPLPIRSLFIGLTLGSLLLLEVCFRRYLWPSATALALFVFEVYWMIPRWNAKSKERQEGPDTEGRVAQT